jgi:hypothetical protein
MTKPYQDYTGAEILDLEFPSPPDYDEADEDSEIDWDQYFSYTFDDNEAFDTVRDYLKGLLQNLWIEGEGFSGKRPFGNSGWEYDLYQPLIAVGFPKDNYREMDEAILRAIDAL